MPEVDGELTPMAEFAATIHEMYLALLASGFTRDEALTVTADMMTKLILTSPNNSGGAGA